MLHQRSVRQHADLLLPALGDAAQWDCIAPPGFTFTGFIMSTMVPSAGPQGLWSSTSMVGSQSRAACRTCELLTESVYMQQLPSVGCSSATAPAKRCSLASYTSSRPSSAMADLNTGVGVMSLRSVASQWPTRGCGGTCTCKACTAICRHVGMAACQCRSGHSCKSSPQGIGSTQMQPASRSCDHQHLPRGCHDWMPCCPT
jgi:hypothetical protein